MFFFQPRTACARAPNALKAYIVRKQFGSTLGDGVDIQPGECGDVAVTAMSQAQRLESGVEPALPLIERAEEQDDGRLGLVRALRQGIT